MAAKRKASTRTRAATVYETPVVYSSPSTNFLNSKNLTIGLVVIALIALAYWKKDWFVAATVNGAPVTTIELQKRISDNYKAKELQELIDEKVILQETAKNNMTPTDSEIEAKYAEFEQQYGGPEEFANLLEMQGETKAGLTRRIRLNIALDKLYSSEATSSEQEVDEYIKVNKSLLKATTSADQRVEAEAAIKEQKLIQIIQQKFQELRDRAVIKIF